MTMTMIRHTVNYKTGKEISREVVGTKEIPEIGEDALFRGECLVRTGMEPEQLAERFEKWLEERRSSRAEA